jgi:uncharacterized protein (TIGR03435 family)
MTRWFACSLVALMSGAAFAQPAETTPRFEAADIHGSPRSTIPVTKGPFYSGGRYELRFATMADLIHTAYGIDTERVFGGPSWLEMDRFDVIAKTPARSTAESRKLMLQSLLADRFGLVVHNDNKPVTAWRLTAVKPKLQEGDGSGETGCNFKVESSQAPAGPPEKERVIALPVLSYTCRNTSMSSFAGLMTAIPGAGQYFDNKPVVDQTGLAGVWDFTVSYTPRIPPGIATTGESKPLPDAVEKQLGLKLELAKTPVPVLVVDSVQEKPTPNPPDMAKIFPPPPTEFDVAEIKPSAAAQGGGRGGPQPEIKNGRLILPGITLKNLVMLAWDLNSDEALIGAPKWLDSDRFDVIAKAPEGVAIGDLTAQTARSISINIDALRPMLRSLLVDRFKMVVHTEERPMPRYTLVAMKPKLQKADPAARTKWTEGPGEDSKDPRKANPVLGRLVTCQNVTMAQFAELLPGIAPGYIRNEVIDATGLQGGWDFTLSFSPAGAGQVGGGRGGDGPPPGPGGANEASDPSGALSLLDALPKQLGLKLEMQKRPTPVVVIDHVDQKPTDN